MARHAAADTPIRISGWIWAALAALIVVAALVVGWFVLADSRSGDRAASSCLDGDGEVTVWADPAAEKLAVSLVDEYNAGDPVVRDRCITAVVETISTAEATRAYREVNPGVAPVWLPAGGDFVPGLSGAPAEIPVVGTDTLVHHIPDDADPDIGNAVTPPGEDSMVAALAAEAAGVEVDPDAPALQQSLDENLSVLSSEGVLDMAGEPVGDVQIPVVAFGSSPAVDEDAARIAADFLSTVVHDANGSNGTDGDLEMITPEPASPWLTRAAGLLAGVEL